MLIYLMLMTFFLVQIPLCSSERYSEIRIVAGSSKRGITISDSLIIFDALLLLIIACIRDVSVGTDTKTYTFWFSVLNEMPIKDVFQWTSRSAIEVGTGVLAKIGLLITNSTLGAWLLIFGTIIACITIFAKKCSCNQAFSIFLFLAFSMFNQSFNISGQYLAAGFLLVSYTYAREKKWVQFLVFVAIAVLMHRSAVIGLVIYPLAIIKKNTVRNSIVIVTTSFILSRFAGAVIRFVVSRTIYSTYLHWEVSSESGIGLIMNILLFAVFAIFYKQMESQDENTSMWLYAAAITLSLNFFISHLGMIARVMVYFKLFYIVSIPSFVNSFKKKNSSLSLVVNAAVILLFAIYYYFSIAFGTCFDTVPYVIRPAM